MIRDPRLVRALLACYPARWRQRYGDEYAQLLCDLQIHRRPALILDSLCGAARARGGVLMSVRAPMSLAVWAAALFTVAGIGFQKLAEDLDGIAGGVYALLVAAAAISLLALIVAAAPAAVETLRNRGAGAWRFVAVPIVGVFTWYGVVRMARDLYDGHGDHTAATIAAFALIVVMGIAVVAATAWAANAVLKRSRAPQSTPVRRSSLAVVAIGMATTTVAALIWGLQVGSQDPSVFHAADGGLLSTPFVPSWIGAMIAMAAATGLAVSAVRAQRAAAR